MKDYILALYVSIRIFFKPYYRNKYGYVPLRQYLKLKDEEKKTKKSKKKVKKSVKKITVPKFEKGEVSKTDSKIRVLSVKEPLDKSYRFKNLPKLNTIWCYGDSNTLQAVGHFGVGQGYKYAERDGNRRRKLRPLLYPKMDSPFDRTHLIPFGYHNSEADSRLLVGWDPTQNQTIMNDFEQEIKKLNREILWLTIIKKENFGASWSYQIYDAKTRKLINRLDLKLKREIVWKI